MKPMKSFYDEQVKEAETDQLSIWLTQVVACISEKCVVPVCRPVSWPFLVSLFLFHSTKLLY